MHRKNALESHSGKMHTRVWDNRHAANQARVSSVQRQEYLEKNGNFCQLAVALAQAQRAQVRPNRRHFHDNFEAAHECQCRACV